MRIDQVAALTWNQVRSIGETSAAIHDGASTAEELAERAKLYVETIVFENFPESVPQQDALILEIGSGLGWIMQAMNNYLQLHGRSPRSITGLDIASNMIDQAEKRIGSGKPFSFLLYDGVTIPLPDASIDLIYSVAALQHVPRPFVFNIFFEMKRLLKPDAFAVFHLLSTKSLSVQEKIHPWKLEIENQIHGRQAHWHHFYTKQELTDVLTMTGFGHVSVKDDLSGSLICCVSNNKPRSLREPSLFTYRSIFVEVLLSKIDSLKRLVRK